LLTFEAQLAKFSDAEKRSWCRRGFTRCSKS
jgi:hypothetical protein